MFDYKHKTAEHQKKMNKKGENVSLLISSFVVDKKTCTKSF